MSSDVTPSAGPITATAGALDLADASRQLLEESFDDCNFSLVDQLVAADARNHDPALPAEMCDLRSPEALKRVVIMYPRGVPGPEDDRSTT